MLGDGQLTLGGEEVGGQLVRLRVSPPVPKRLMVSYTSRRTQLTE